MRYKIPDLPTSLSLIVVSLNGFFGPKAPCFLPAFPVTSQLASIANQGSSRIWDKVLSAYNHRRHTEATSLQPPPPPPAPVQSGLVQRFECVNYSYLKKLGWGFFFFLGGGHCSWSWTIVLPTFLDVPVALASSKSVMESSVHCQCRACFLVCGFQDLLEGESRLWMSWLWQLIKTNTLKYQSASITVSSWNVYHHISPEIFNGEQLTCCWGSSLHQCMHLFIQWEQSWQVMQILDAFNLILLVTQCEKNSWPWVFLQHCSCCDKFYNSYLPSIFFIFFVTRDWWSLFVPWQSCESLHCVCSESSLW